MNVRTIQVIQNVLASNDDLASRNQERLNQAGVKAVNIIASPGAGKTSLIIQTIAALQGRARIGVIEGDIAGSIDTVQVLTAGAAEAVQINTGGNCHLEAHMIDQALNRLELTQFDVLFIENVGNLVCPTHWRLGEHLKVCLASTAEGDDKPVKYPEIFAASDAILLNKIDLIEMVDFDREFFYRSVHGLNPQAPILEISCRNRAGIQEWVDWLMHRLDC
jgi:hydrogenase nickel incorporation protein HypB